MVFLAINSSFRVAYLNVFLKVKDFHDKVFSANKKSNMINVNLPFSFNLQISVWITYDPATETKRFLAGYTFGNIYRPVAFVQVLTSINYMYLKVETLNG